MRRRDFLRTLFLGALPFVAGAEVLAALQPLVVNRRRIFMAGLPHEFEGIRVAHLSDFHHGPLVSLARIRGAVRLANSLQPDLVALTGDYIHRGREWADGCFRELAHLQAPLGVFAVLGNHDHYAKAAGHVRAAMGRADIQELTNCGVNLRRNRGELRLGGVGDLWTEKQDLRTALGRGGRADSVILLSHNPDYAERIRDDRVGLVLSGHTHGGQCVFPFLGAPILPSRYGQKYASGLCRAPVAKVFVTTGIGHSAPPVRINCPAEVALLTLTGKARNS
jgi:predicted MPP superfamily phosphohydrolase